MVPTPSKRPASTSPDNSRPSKRHATSSPEEGELDDASPPPPTAPRTPSPLKAPPKSANKVPFPFKKKSENAEDMPESRNGLSKGRAPLVYERSQEDERRFREEDERRSIRPRPIRSTQSREVDRWQPTAGRYDTSRRDRQDYLYESRHYPRDFDKRDYPSHRGTTPRRDPERHHVSRSPSSPRSRSPLTPTSQKEKHRLPPPRPPAPLEDIKYSWQPTSGHYDTSRRDRQDYSYESRHYPRDFDKRDYPSYRGTTPRRDSERHHVSRSPSSPRSRSPLTPTSQREKHRLPPPRPPAPPEDMKDSSLPVAHPAVVISMPSRKPPTPLPPRSPPPLPSVLPTGDSQSKRVVATDHRTEPSMASRDGKIMVRRQKRKPVQRSREEEQRLYGRLFVGCGKQEDYNMLTKLGEGTFGEVHKAVHWSNGHTVALKRILMHNEKEGMPVTALREIKILKALKHPCVVDILDMFVVRSHGKDSPLSVYMVFPYMDHDLAGLLENERVKLSPSQIKLYMKQLLEGTEYMHRNHILHRDLKAANLLISNTGCLKIADFGLARAFDPNIVRGGGFKEDARGKERKYTNCVVTRWYRPPELLLGARQYGGEVDLWGVGCVLGEMFWRKPILPGSSDLDQLDKIWQLCGTPTQQSWPNHDALPGCEGIKRFNMYPRRLKQVYEMIGPETCDLLDKLLTCNPRNRITAAEALDHAYFWTDPLPADPKTLPTYEASHEFDKRGRRNQPPAGPPVPPPHGDGPRQLPMPLSQAPHIPYGRPPPPREAFRNGPPPHYHSATTQGLPPPTFHGYGPGPGYYPPPPQRYPHGAPPMPPPTLMPISLRPGQPPPQIVAIQPPLPPFARPSHLPARPPLPMGRGGGPPYRDQYHHDGHAGYGGGGELNYG